MSKTYIICATQRSGSTLLINDLKNAGLGNPGEHYLGFIRNQNFLYTEDNIKNYLIRIHRKATANSITSIKIMCDQVPKIDSLLNFQNQESDLLWNNFKQYYKDATWVYISRGDLVAQAKSQLLAKSSRVNHLKKNLYSTFTPGNSITEHVPYLELVKSLKFNPQDFKSRIIKIAKQNALWESFFHAHKIKPTRIFYENIVDNCTYLNVFKAKIDTFEIFNLRSLKKLNNYYLSNGLENFLEIKD